MLARHFDKIGILFEASISAAVAINAVLAPIARGAAGAGA
jgi:hypothetical protein